MWIPFTIYFANEPLHGYCLHCKTFGLMARISDLYELRCEKCGTIYTLFGDKMRALDYKPVPARAKIDILQKKENIVYEAKIDGCRALIGNVNELFMRGKNVGKSGDYHDKTEHFPLLCEWMRNAQDWIIDGEVWHPNGIEVMAGIFNGSVEHAQQKQQELGPARYYVFDVLMADGVDVRNLPLSERMAKLSDVYEIYGEHFKGELLVKPVPLIFAGVDGHKMDLDLILNIALGQGYEGIVAKNWDGPYHHREWAKVKPFETYDYIITGYEQSESETFEGNGIAAIKLGLFKGSKIIETTKCSGMTHEWRREFYDNGDKYIGMVVEVSAQAQNKNGALRHPNFKRVRPEANSQEQTFGKYGL